jgi:hypothetical protein
LGSTADGNINVDESRTASCSNVPAKKILQKTGGFFAAAQTVTPSGCPSGRLERILPTGASAVGVSTPARGLGPPRRIKKAAAERRKTAAAWKKKENIRKKRLYILQTPGPGYGYIQNQKFDAPPLSPPSSPPLSPPAVTAGAGSRPVQSSQV